MTKREAEKRITALENEYPYSATWPVECQREYEALCAIIWAQTKQER